MKVHTLILVSGILIGTVSGAEVRLGVIGTDTSHVIAFASALNDSTGKDHVDGARIVIAYKGGSPDVELSRNRVDRFADELQSKFHVRLVNQIPDMCDAIDGILLESVDGRSHLSQMKEALKCEKPIFIDKPMASSVRDAHEIARLAAAAHVPWFSASDMRFSAIESLKNEPVTGAIVWGPGPIEAHQPLDLSFYGIHAVEMLYTLMGSGCRQVTRTHAKDADVVTCRWTDGRIGTIRVDRPSGKSGAVVFRPTNQLDVMPQVKADYTLLVRKIVEFMTTRIPPVPNTETLEIIKFLDAAQRSEKNGGKPVAM